MLYHKSINSKNKNLSLLFLNEPVLGHWALFGYLQSPLPENELQSASLNAPVLHVSGQHRFMSLPQLSQYFEEPVHL